MNLLEFNPPRRAGYQVHLVLMIVLAGISGVSSWLATNTAIGLRLALYILLAAFTFFPLPILAYRLWALVRAGYRLDRDSLTITWGLRVERIPVSEIEWVRPPGALAAPLQLPAIRMPGAILGSRNVRHLGPVEFLASSSKTLLVLATPRHTFAISPSDPKLFLENIQRAIEMGSLSPVVSESVYPSFLIGEAWESRLVRWLWLAGLFVNIGLIVWVSLIVPGLGKIPLVFLPSGAPGNPVPGAGLILLPVLSIFFFLLGWLAGLVFYRRPDHHVLAQIVWAGGLVSSVFFLVAMMFIVTTPV